MAFKILVAFGGHTKRKIYRVGRKRKVRLVTPTSQSDRQTDTRTYGWVEEEQWRELVAVGSTGRRKKGEGGKRIIPPSPSSPQQLSLFSNASSKETTLERADFYAGWSELSWSGRAQSIVA